MRSGQRCCVGGLRRRTRRVLRRVPAARGLQRVPRGRVLGWAAAAHNWRQVLPVSSRQRTGPLLLGVLWLVHQADRALLYQQLLPA